MATLSIYIDGTLHNISTQSTAYDVEAICDTLNDYFTSRNIPLEAYWQNVPNEPIPPWEDDGSPNESGGSGTTTFASFNLKRIPSDRPPVNNAAIYDRAIPSQEPWHEGVDINSIMMGYRYIDFNNSRNDKIDPQNIPADWLAVGNFQTDYAITAINVSNVKASTGNISVPISVDKTKPYDYDPRIATQVIKFTSDKTIVIQVSAAGGAGNMRFKSFTGNEWDSSDLLESFANESYRQASNSGWGSVNNKDGYFPVRAGKATWVLMTDAQVERGFLPASRNSEFNLICTRFTVFNRSSNITATIDSSSLQCMIPINAWGGGYREMFGSYIYNGFWAFIPKHTEDRTYSFAYDASRVDIDSLYYFFSDFNNALSNDDDGLVLIKAESVWDVNYAIHRTQITIPANKSMMLFLAGKGYSYPIYGNIVP